MQKPRWGLVPQMQQEGWNCVCGSTTVCILLHHPM